MNRISSQRFLTITWVRWQCSQNISWVSKEKGLFGLHGRSGGKFKEGFGGDVGSLGGNGGRGEGKLWRSGKQKSVGSKFMASGEEGSDGWVGAGRREVKGGGVDFRVSRTLLGEIPGDIMGESGGEAFRVDGGAD
ncbi:hypothetical protein Tco_0331297 [Tanacetum coccineum]